MLIQFPLEVSSLAVLENLPRHPDVQELLPPVARVPSCGNSSLSAVVASPEPGLPPSASGCMPGSVLVTCVTVIKKQTDQNNLREKRLPWAHSHRRISVGFGRESLAGSLVHGGGSMEQGCSHHSGVGIRGCERNQGSRITL